MDTRATNETITALAHALPGFIFLVLRVSLIFVLASAFSILLGLNSVVFANGKDGLYLVPKGLHSAPAGFLGVCSRYPWACAASGKSHLSSMKIFGLAKAINTQVNHQTREIEDWRQYGKEEHWALPTTLGGDCEDFVLAKKMALLEHGVPSEKLLIATVLDHQMNSHAVLVLRTENGDVVLDNLTEKVLPWRKTGYTFLRLQNPNMLKTWHSVLAGGVLTDAAPESE